MRRKCFVSVVAVLAACFSLAVPSAEAQDQKIMDIRKIQGGKVKTPEYQLLKGQTMGKTRDWAQIVTIYDTAPDWVDELNFTYYVLLKDRKNKYNLFRGDVAYVNIEKGRQHKSDVYLHPSTLARFGDVDRVAVVVSSQGKVVAMDTIPSTNQRWWEQLTPIDGQVLNRMETPFAMVNFDEYEAIKARTPAR